MTNLNKKTLADAVVAKLGITKKDASLAIDSIFEEITKTLSEGGKVDISGFGKFEVTTRSERVGINPATKEKITIPASKSAKFKAAKALKEAVK